MKPKAINLSCDLSPDYAQLPAVFTLSKPNAIVVSKTVLTDDKGIAVAQFSLGSRYPHGTYVGKVEIVVNGIRTTDQKSVVL